MNTHEAKNPMDLFKVLGEMTKPETAKTERPLFEIAAEIKKDWGVKVNFGARPYLDAMSTLTSIDDKYGYDSADSIVRYFLSNAGTWRGETAKRVKVELKKMVGLK